MKVSLDGERWAEFMWSSDSAVRLGSDLMFWLNRHNVWDGPDRHFAEFHEPEDLKKLESWDHVHQYWLSFDFNCTKTAEEFRQAFTDWKPSMRHAAKIKIPEIGRYEKALLDQHRSWLRERGQTLQNYCRQPCPESYSEDQTWVYEFDDLSIAMLFKLTWAGVRVQDPDE